MMQAASQDSPIITPSLLDQVANELKWKIQGEVRFDSRAKALYATDASPYEIMPLGVVLPKTIEDIKHVVDIANKYRLAVLPRGGGTSLAGQTVGEAIVLDVSKYLTQILDFNPEERWVKVQPGVVRDELNQFLAPHSLQFTPDISTTNRANVGGMVANNSAGTRSIKYGKTVDAVISMTVMFADGSIAELKALNNTELKQKLELKTLEGKIYRTVHKIVTEHKDEIEARFPKVMRRVGGYNLDEFTQGQAFNLAKLVSGSEGTLAIILNVTLRLEPVPKYRMLSLLHYKTLNDSLRSVKYINEHNPSAVEIFDDELFKLGLANPNLSPMLGWLNGMPEAVLMVEFDGTTAEEMEAGFNSMMADERISNLAYHNYVAREAAKQFEVLEFRRAGLGIYSTVKGKLKPTAFIEDAAIPPEHLANYIPEVKAVCEKYNVPVVFYGHASVGVIHSRPLLDLKTAEGVKTYENVSRDVFELVKKYGGSWSGEHGDGLIRSYQNQNLFGDIIYQDFQTIKSTFDPKNLMNPGKIVDSPPMTENLRYGDGYPNPELETYFDFSDDGGYLGAIEMCTGVGACRKTTTGTMCPSYMATRDEDHSTRGRANILREAMNGRLPGGLTSQEVYDVLDLCLECKACKAECPSQVDMAKIKYEFLQQYYDKHGTPLGVKAFAYAFKTSPLGNALAPLANRVLPISPFRWMLEKTLNVDKRRVMPSYAKEGFGKFIKNHKASTTANKAKVALFTDTWTMYHEPEVGIAATKVLEHLGYSVEFINYQCCGRTLISKGLLKDAKKQAEKNVKTLSSYVEQGIPVVGLEPSCVSAFQDDYRDLIPGEKTSAVADHVKMIDQFLAKEWTQGKLEPSKSFKKSKQPVMLHGHCQQRAIMGTNQTKAVLGWTSEQVQEVDSGCCGMAGSFGYSHYDVSMQIGERRLFPAVREHAGEVAACGFSCRHQIKDGTQRESKHVIELLAEAIP
ncbi:MAG: FAD-binding protein [Trueperaceae bacterium]|nr:FAD-binding protein [Trueperaceae bacterium]